MKRIVAKSQNYKRNIKISNKEEIVHQTMEVKTLHKEISYKTIVVLLSHRF